MRHDQKNLPDSRASVITNLLVDYFKEGQMLGRLTAADRVLLEADIRSLYGNKLGDVFASRTGAKKRVVKCDRQNAL